MKVYNLKERTVEETTKLGKVGIVETAKSVAKKWEIKQRLAHDKLERVDEFETPNGEAMAEPIARQRVSLGKETYLDAVFQMPEKSMVADIQKNPIHRWKRPKLKRGKRGTVTGFSKKSQMRMMKKCASIARGVPCHFVSLTFPCKVAPKDAKEHLWAFWRRLERTRLYRSQKEPRKGMIWKIEVQKNGNPHFHLFIYGFRFIPEKWIKACWSSVIGSGGIKGAWHAGVDIKHINGNFKAVRSYITKYMTKDDGEFTQGLGRVWGKRGDLPINDTVEMGMTVRELICLWRCISRMRKVNVVNMNTVFFSDHPEMWFDNVKKILEPPVRSSAQIKESMKKMRTGDCAELNAEIKIRNERRARAIAKRDAEFDKQA